MKRKKLLFVTAVAAIIISLSGLCACRRENTDGGDSVTDVNGGSEYTDDGTEGLEYKLNPDRQSYKVSGIGTACDRVIRISQTHNGLPVTAIASSAFRWCSLIESITVPDSVTMIGANAFGSCASLTDVNIPDGITAIADGAFSGCAALAYAAIPQSVVSIGRNAFRDCASIVNIDIPQGVSYIYDCAFSGCVSLESVTVSDSVKYISGSAFEGCSSLKEFTVDADNKDYKSKSGCLLTKSGKMLIRGTNAGVIPDGVSYIGSHAFSGNTFVGITIPEAVTAVGDCAFENCIFLSEINLHDGILSIGSCAFSGCSAIEKISIPDSVTYLDWYTFDGCSSLYCIYINKGIDKIGEWVFNACPALSRIYYGGTAKQWSEISKAVNWNANCGNYAVICSDAVIEK